MKTTTITFRGIRVPVRHPETNEEFAVGCGLKNGAATQSCREMLASTHRRALEAVYLELKGAGAWDTETPESLSAALAEVPFDASAGLWQHLPRIYRQEAERLMAMAEVDPALAKRTIHGLVEANEELMPFAWDEVRLARALWVDAERTEKERKGRVGL